MGVRGTVGRAGAPAVVDVLDSLGALTGGATDDDTPTIIGTAEALSTVEVFDGTTSLGTTTADGSGDW